MSQPTALLLHLQRLSTEDGPGLRTTVFFKGCPLQCAWCHNPESISPRPQVHWIEARCIGCRTCLPVCPQSGLSLNGNGLHIDRSLCNGCGLCCAECPTLALELLGTRTGLEELFLEVTRDRAFFDRSERGGVTLSGGEPLLQPAFTSAFLQRLSEAGVHTALDTCGLCTPQTLHQVLPYTDLVLYDLKIIDPVLHLKLTGVSNEVILENLVALAMDIRRQGKPSLWIRTPLIPGATADPANVKAIGAYLAQYAGDVVERWELLAFNNLARDKYRRLGLTWPYEDQPLMRQTELDELEHCARVSGVDAAVVSVTGASKMD